MHARDDCDRRVGLALRAVRDHFDRCDVRLVLRAPRLVIDETRLDRRDLAL